MVGPDNFPRNDLDTCGEVDAPVTRTGDVWFIGRHRIICADSTDTQKMRCLFGDSTADLVFTSPPYDNQRAYKLDGPIVWTDMMKGVTNAIPAGESTQFLVNLGLVHRHGSVQEYWRDWLDWLRDPSRADSWRHFGLYVWNQGHGLPGNWGGRLAPSFEHIFHFNRQSRPANKIVRCSSVGTSIERLMKKSCFRNHDGSIKKLKNGLVKNGKSRIV
jgi:hypothetical protein